jgi:hypothetical protein
MSKCIMKKRLPRLSSNKAAEDFVATADLTRYDLSAMMPVRFEFKPKTERVNMRIRSIAHQPAGGGELAPKVQRRDGVARRQHHELHGAGEEERISRDEECVGAHLGA